MCLSQSWWWEAIFRTFAHAQFQQQLVMDAEAFFFVVKSRDKTAVIHFSSFTGCRLWQTCSLGRQELEQNKPAHLDLEGWIIAVAVLLPF